VLVLGLLGPVPAATAASSYVCTGYDRCSDRGYSHFGYKRHNDRMWWRMYAGHNCTNYVAYRLVKGGMPDVRPWDGSGNASNWGPANPRITDDKPMVGAVAWWRANVPGAGSSGHVAYVQKVVSRRRIVVSEDSWGGDFHWRTITKRGTGWPSGFVHFDDREVRATRKPVIEGTPAVGRTLRVDPGRWRPEARLELQWFAGGEPVAGATGTTFTPGPEQRRQRLSVRVTARARGYLPGKVTTPRTDRVARGTMAATTAPVLTGTARVGETLQLLPGSVTPAQQSRTYRWLADGSRIDGVSGTRLRLTPELRGTRIRAVVVSRREGYHPHVATTDPTAAVERGRIVLTSPFTVSGTPRYDRRLEVAPGSSTPADARASYSWLRDGRPIAGAHSRAYAATRADVGRVLSVRVDLERDGYRDKSLTLDTGGPVVTPPTLRLDTTGRPHRALVVLRVTAPGVSRPGGEATVRIDGRSETAAVVDGRMRVVVRGLDPGRHTVRVAYTGTRTVLPGATSATVRVRRG
jgi:surface antigen